MGGRAVEGTGLENRQGLIAPRGFESHPIRHIAFAVLRHTDPNRWLRVRNLSLILGHISFAVRRPNLLKKPALNSKG